MSAIVSCRFNVSWGAVYIETNYGLMQHSFIEIKNKLIRALDSEYNVVDMASVFEVVAVLERTPITPEILETTRLGKVINECRRRTNNEALAKRAKHLLRYWRNMMIAPAPNVDRSNTSIVSPSAPTCTLPPSSSSIPQQNGTSVRSSAATKADRVVTPSISPALSNSSSISRSSNVYDSKISPSSSLSPVGDHKVESVPKTHVANKRLRKNAATSPVLGEPPAKVSKLNGSVFAERMTTENTVDCDFSRVREPAPVTEDDEAAAATLSSATCRQNVVTESVPNANPSLPKKRNRKKNKKRCDDDDIEEKLVALSKTVRVKTTEELVAELKSRSEDRLQGASTSGISVKPSLCNNVSGGKSAGTVADDLQTTSEKDEHLDPETRMEREIAKILSKLPPVNADEIVWESPPVSAPSTPKPVTEEDVDRYLQQQWDDVNGCVTHAVPTPEEGAFRQWHEMVARRTMNDDLIHILPYSIVD